MKMFGFGRSGRIDNEQIFNVGDVTVKIVAVNQFNSNLFVQHKGGEMQFYASGPTWKMNEEAAKILGRA